MFKAIVLYLVPSFFIKIFYLQIKTIFYKPYNQCNHNITTTNYKIGKTITLFIDLTKNFCTVSKDTRGTTSYIVPYCIYQHTIYNKHRSLK